MADEATPDGRTDDERTDYERIGGHEALVGHLDAFIDRVADDFIIGFLFVGRDLDRIKAHEVELAAAHLGGPRAYTGRPIHRVHGPLRINRGQFRRRLALLRTVLRERGVPDDLIARWIAHDERFEAAVTDGTDCGPADRPVGD